MKRLLSLTDMRRKQRRPRPESKHLIEYRLRIRELQAMQALFGIGMKCETENTACYRQWWLTWARSLTALRGRAPRPGAKSKPRKLPEIVTVTSPLPAGNGSSLDAAASLLDAPGGLTEREPAQKHDELFAADANHSRYVADRLQMSQKLQKLG